MGIAATARTVLALHLVITGVAICGCGGGDATNATAPAEGTQSADSTDFLARDWCVEHGVPESQCGRCDTKVAAKLQQEGDWCEEHNRPESQCFLCRPDAEAKFAAVYTAKFGEQPPKPTE